MLEVRVQCTCTAIQLTDLGEKLFRGDVLFLSKERAEKSKDLALAKQNHGVVCTDVTRCQEQRPAASAPAPFRPQIREAKNPGVPTTGRPVPTKAPPPPVFNQDDLVRQIAEKVVKALNKPVMVFEPPIIEPAKELEPEVISEIEPEESNGAYPAKKKRKKNEEV